MKVANRRDCPGCSSGRAKTLGSKNGFEILSCFDCKTLYTAELPKANEKEDYDSYYTAENLSIPDFVIKRVGEIVEEFEPYRKTNKLLDIGFGAGTILEAAAKRGWAVAGLEVSRPAVEQARQKGFEVFQGLLNEANYPPGQFDVVTASEILEHLESPKDDLAEIARILRPGGLLWATTPSARGISPRMLGIDWSVMAPPEHTQLYSTQGLEGLLNGAGFDVAKILTHGTNPFEIMYHFRKGRSSQSTDTKVETSYSLNEKFTSSPSKTLIKSLINLTLNATGLGDSIKIYAVKRS
jgi:2-polyprenyl-3-methyl-5-hydroxy-6-metoxy-1,4-benzoquinol methylase